MIKKIATVMAAGAALYGVSNATVLDFTVDATPAIVTDTIFGVTYTVTTEPMGQLTNSELENGDTCETVLTGLACVRDGFGVADDEVSSGDRPEMIKVSFDDNVLINAFYILDLFRSSDGQNFEVGEYSIDGGATWVSFGSILNEAVAASNSGAFIQVVSAITNSIWFRAPNVMFNNDNLGVNDFAIAGLDVQFVPIPGAAVLLLTGMAGFGFASRKRKAA